MDLNNIEEVKDGYTESPFIKRFTLEDNLYTYGFDEYSLNKIIRFKDKKNFLFTLESEKLNEIFYNNIDLCSTYFEESEGKLFISIGTTENFNGNDKLKGIYSLTIDEDNSKLIAKQIINEDYFIPVFYNGHVSLSSNVETKLYNLETGKEVFSVKEKNIKAILKLNK